MVQMATKIIMEMAIQTIQRIIMGPLRRMKMITTAIAIMVLPIITINNEKDTSCRFISTTCVLFYTKSFLTFFAIL